MKDRFLEMASNAAMGIGLLENESIQWMNEKMSRMFGFESSEKYRDAALSEFFASDEEFKHFRQNIFTKLPLLNTAEGEVVFKRNDGSKFLGHIKLSCKDSGDLQDGILINISDISRIKKRKEMN